MHGPHIDQEDRLRAHWPFVPARAASDTLRAAYDVLISAQSAPFHQKTSQKGKSKAKCPAGPGINPRLQRIGENFAKLSGKGLSIVAQLWLKGRRAG